MKFRKILALLLSLMLICALFAACGNESASDEETKDGEKSNTEGTTTQKEEETIFTIIKGAYKQEDSYGSTTFIFDGSDVTYISKESYYDYDEDCHYESEITASGTFTIAEEEDAIKGTFTWTNTEQGTPSFRFFTYDPENKTITSATDFQTYVFEKQK